MDLYNKEIIHYPTLKTVLMIEKILKSSEKAMSREELKSKMPVKIMHQTLNLVLAYLEDKNLILDGRKGIIWTHNLSPKLKKALDKAVEI